MERSPKASRMTSPVRHPYPGAAVVEALGAVAEVTGQCSPPTCKAKVLGVGDDFAMNIRTVGDPS